MPSINLKNNELDFTPTFGTQQHLVSHAYASYQAVFVILLVRSFVLFGQFSDKHETKIFSVKFMSRTTSLFMVTTFTIPGKSLIT